MACHNWMLLGAAGLALCVPAQAARARPERPVISSAAALPRLSYRLPDLPSRMIADARMMAALAADVEYKSRELLERNDIRDAATRRDLQDARRIAALAREDLGSALRFDRASREGEAGMNLSTDLLVAALAATRGLDGERRQVAARAALARRLARVAAGRRGQVVALRRELALASSAYRLGEIAAFADPEWRRTPEVGQDFAVAMLRLWVEIRLRNPLLDAYDAELSRWLAGHQDERHNIWAERESGPAARSASARVVVAVWDAVDPALFPGRVEGLAFDERFAPAASILPPVPPALVGHLGDYERYMRGLGDLSAGLDSADVAFARSWRRRLVPAEVEAFENGLDFYTNYIHGTHVAGIALRGLETATLVPVRITFSTSRPPPLLDEAAARRFTEMARTAVQYMRSRGARLCNISWGFTQADIEANLAQNGEERDAGARARRAAVIFAIMLAGMREAIAAAPEILFMAAAGNARQDVDFVQDLPGSINLPNMLTVAAADEQGRAASFASTGSSVDIYARGTNVESLVPGGGRIRWSGASLAAPQAINAAARLLALDPSLRSDELARLLTETASPAPGARLPLLNPRAAQARLLHRLGGKRRSP